MILGCLGMVVRRSHRRCWWLLPLCALGGCGVDAPLENYLTRLGRSLDQVIEPTGERLPVLPRARERQLDVQMGNLDLLDLLALRGCELSITIGKMNSSLGKLASASQRLLLELEFLSLAPACIAYLDPQEQSDLIAALHQAVSRKRQQLQARIWNATLGGQ